MWGLSDQVINFKLKNESSQNFLKPIPNQCNLNCSNRYHMLSISHSYHFPLQEKFCSTISIKSIHWLGKVIEKVDCTYWANGKLTSVQVWLIRNFIFFCWIFNSSNIPCWLKMKVVWAHKIVGYALMPTLPIGPLNSYASAHKVTGTWGWPRHISTSTECLLHLCQSHYGPSDLGVAPLT